MPTTSTTTKASAAPEVRPIPVSLEAWLADTRAYGIAGDGREHEANPDPRYNPQVREQILISISAALGVLERAN
jgi:hypothetical protein